MGLDQYLQKRNTETIGTWSLKVLGENITDFKDGWKIYM